MPSEAHDRDAGAALVEATMVLPILIALVFVVMDGGLYAWNTGLAAKAVQLGVRRAVVSDAVAIGPGLQADPHGSYWDGLPPGLSCFPASGARSPCPVFTVTCGAKEGCRCGEGACPFSFSAANLQPIVEAMQNVLPTIRPENVEVSYATNGLGYVDRPPPVPVDVRVTLVGLYYRPLTMGSVFKAVLPLRGSAALPSESLVTR